MTRQSLRPPKLRSVTRGPAQLGSSTDLLQTGRSSVPAPGRVPAAMSGGCLATRHACQLSGSQFAYLAVAGRPTAAGGTIETLAVKLTWTSVPCSPAVLGAGQQLCQWPIFGLDPALALDRPQGGQWTEGESRSSSRPRLDGHACTPGAANLTPLTTGCVTSGATSQTLGQRRRLAPESALAGPAPASALRTERRRLARRRLVTRRSDQWRSGADRRRQSLSRLVHRVQLHKTAAGSRVTWPERRRPIVVAGATLPILGRLIGLAAADL